MKKEYIPIYKIAGKIQYLTEVLPQIETNTILCKTLTGLGATYSEIKAKRHSIISVPYRLLLASAETRSIRMTICSVSSKV